MVVRRHWIVLVEPMAIFFIFAVLPWGAYLLIGSMSWYPVFSSFFRFLAAGYLLILWNLLFYNIVIYLLNTVVVTNKRVIENQQKGFFKYTTNELERDKIQDVSVKIYGPLASLLNYGDIEIQTAGTINKFYFYYIPRPQKIKEIIVS